jgi:tetratricopeptide (TPR) repeat protein
MDQTTKLPSPSKALAIVSLLCAILPMTQERANAQNTQSTDKRGQIPELQASADSSEATNEQRALESEILISRTENKAIEALQRILAGKMGKPEEADLQYRLAELYMRRSKSGRFFELHQNTKTSLVTSVPIPNLKGADQIKKAIAIYNRIEHNFKTYPEMDSVLFNNAFAHQQINLSKVAETLYKKLIDLYPKSHLLPDGLLALAELLYDQQRFSEALPFFAKLESFPAARVYGYGMYKMAWTHYNLKDSQSGVQKLQLVVKLSPPGKEASRGYNLREESLRDLTIFIGDIIGPSGVYPFFAKITTEEELGQAMLNTARLYDSHSRYKEIPIFINEYNKTHPKSAVLVKTNLILVNSFEVLKKREEVLEKLKAASELCQSGSAWRKEQTPEIIAESCQKKFREESLEISKKWWDIWSKNKSHKEFSFLTERALRLILDLDDEKAPDLKTRYALAELLFQSDKFEESSAQYKLVADRTPDPVQAHDSAYAALYSIEKAIEKTPQKSALRKSLVQNYLSKHPKGEHFLPVKFKWALILYEENKLDEALKVLEELTALGTKGQAVLNKNAGYHDQIKSEDLILDIYNLKKNFTSLRLKAKELTARAANPERKLALNKIYEEAQYSEAQAIADTGDKLKAAGALQEFIKDHPKSPMNSEAHWQALSLYYAQGNLQEGSDLSLEFFKKYPNDKRALDALKEAISSKIELGALLVAAELLQQLSLLDPKNSEIHRLKAAQFFWLEGHKKETRSIYTQILQSSMIPEKKKDFQNLLHSTYSKSDQSTPEYKSFMQGLIDQGVEPYTTESLIAKAQTLLDTNKRSEAFELSRKIMSRSVDSSLKAKAGLIQAKILEDEFKSQSVKSSSEERFALVLTMKAERMEKTLTSYLSVLRISNQIEIRIQALHGIDRVYTNYIESISDLRGPASVNEGEMADLKAELMKTLDPIKEKRLENKNEIARLLKQTLESESRSWGALAASESIPPKLEESSSLAPISPFLPEVWTTKDGNWKEFKSSKPQCQKPSDQKTPLVASPPVDDRLKATNSCALLSGQQKSQQERFRENIDSLLRDSQTRPWGFFYLSLLSEMQGLHDKAFWSAEKASLLLKDPNQGSEPIWFQKFRMKVKSRGWIEARGDFQKIIDLKTNSQQIDLLKAVQFYRLAQYSKTSEILSESSQEDLDKSNLSLVLSEAYAQKGDIDRALSSIRRSQIKNSVDAWIQTGRIFETFKPNIEKAKEAYTQALNVSAEPEQKKWLERKLAFLKNMEVPKS